MRVKVCGITNYADAALALDHGVDALGFNFYSASPRYIDPARARNIIRRLPPLATTVGLFVNVPDPQEVAEIAQVAGIQVLQLHGDESPGYCLELVHWPLIKAVRIGTTPQPDFSDYAVQAVLLDALDETRFGGTGKTFDWTVLRRLPVTLPIILAGGLGPGNVGEAIRMVRPYAVDVCSGVESYPGQKNAPMLIAFMKEVANASRSE